MKITSWKGAWAVLLLSASLLSSCGGAPETASSDGIDPFKRFNEPVKESARDPLAGDPARAAFKPECLALQPVEVERSVQAPSAIFQEQPDLSTTLRIQGRIQIEAIVDASGMVCDARLISGLESRLDQACLAAAKKWVFRPARKLGDAVAVFHKLNFAFDLK